MDVGLTFRRTSCLNASNVGIASFKASFLANRKPKAVGSVAWAAKKPTNRSRNGNSIKLETNELLPEPKTVLVESALSCFENAEIRLRTR